MRTFAIAAVVALAGCSSVVSTPFAPAATSLNVPQLVAQSVYKNGIYVAQFDGTAVYGYFREDRRNGPPVCGESNQGLVADVSTDPQGNLMVPSELSVSVHVFAGPRMCGKEAANLADPYGLPVDVASTNALTGTIAVANIEDDGPISNPPPGSITLCTVAHGCSANLVNRHMHRVAGIAIDKHGNCWASAVNKAGAATLIFFRHCTGSGRPATGYQNASYGGLDLDANGNLIAIDYANRQVFIYSGCSPACTLVAGPLALQGQAIYGKLNHSGTEFAAADYQDARVDLYAYSGTSLTYQFSFNQDLTPSGSPEGIAFTPGL